MSLSELPGAGPQLREIIKQRQKTWTGLEKMPPVIVLADIFRQGGSYGFRELMEQIERAGDAIVPDEKVFQLEEQYAAIVFGISIRSLHAMLAEGSFDGQVWCERYNLATADTPFTGLQVKGKPIDEEVAVEGLVILRQLALEDKTLSFFFEHPYTMPNMLRKILEDLGVLSLIQSKILPLYRERAQYLLNSPKS